MKGNSETQGKAQKDAVLANARQINDRLRHLISSVLLTSDVGGEQRGAPSEKLGETVPAILQAQSVTATLISEIGSLLVNLQ